MVEIWIANTHPSIPLIAAMSEEAAMNYHNGFDSDTYMKIYEYS